MRFCWKTKKSKRKSTYKDTLVAQGPNPESQFAKAEELSHLAGTIAVLTGEQDFMAMDVLTRMLLTAMVEGDLEALTKVMADFAVKNSNKGKQDAIDDLIDATQNERGVN